MYIAQYIVCQIFQQYTICLKNIMGAKTTHKAKIDIYGEVHYNITCTFVYIM
jgi:hypothetical protein